MSDSINVLPCPFCGKDGGEINYNAVCCPHCDAEGPIVYDDANFNPPVESDIIAAWNRRSQPVTQETSQYVWRVRWLRIWGLRRQFSRMQNAYFDTERDALMSAANKIESGEAVEPVKRFRIIQD